jgi:hypothetical protein
MDQENVRYRYIYTMEFYSTIKNDDMWSEGKWMQLEDIMLSEISQVQKAKGCIFSLKCEDRFKRYTYTEKTNMIIHICR